MFPLEVILIGPTERVLASIRHELVAVDAAISAEFPDVATAMASLGEPAGRRLFLFHIREADDLRQLQKLVSSIAGQPVLALVDPEIQEVDEQSRMAFESGLSAVGRASLFIQAMRGGAMQVVPLPLETADFREALNCLARQFGQAPESTLIAVSGVHGGCGATMLAINLAHAISEMGDQLCVLAELTPDAGILATLLNIKPECTLGELLEREHPDAETIRQCLVPITPKLSVLCGPYQNIVVRLASEWAASSNDMLSILESLRRLAPMVVVDVPALFDETYFETLRKADKVLLVTDQTIPGMHCLQMVGKALVVNERQTLDVVVNRFDPRAKGLSLTELKPFVKGAVHTLGADAEMVAAGNEGRLVQMSAPRARITAEIKELAGLLVKPSTPTPPPAGFWEKFFGRKQQPIAVGG